SEVYGLTVKDSNDPITLTVKSNKNLTSATNVVIDSHGAITLESGSSLNGNSVTIQGGGQLSGDGTVGANLTLINGALKPGISVGHLDVDGDYQQASGGTLIVDISDSGGSPQFDSVTTTGNATLSGKLKIDASFFTGVYPTGTKFPIFTAANI